MHQPVLVNEVLELLQVKRGGTYVDGTLGNGGHAAAILELLGGDGFLLGLDRDEEALERSRARLAGWKNQCSFVHGNHEDMTEIASKQGIEQVDGVLLDLGVSSEQLDTPERGFSFNSDGPLDMRMDRTTGVTAADLVNSLTSEELCSGLREHGEEPRARRIADAIVRERQSARITTTAQLSGLVEKAAGGRRGHLHPATRTFQALRIMVNNEMGSLKKTLPVSLNLLKEGGRMAVISFHSLEDRNVKGFFKSHAGRWESLQAGGRRLVVEEPVVRVLTKKPVTASPHELTANPRSRSAKLRAAERIRADECNG